MTSFVSGGALNSTHSLTTALFMSMTIMIPVSSALEHSVRKWGRLPINTWDAPNSTQSKKPAHHTWAPWQSTPQMSQCMVTCFWKPPYRLPAKKPKS